MDTPVFWIERACVAAGEIEDPSQRVQAYVQIVKLQASTGDIDGAKETTRFIKKASPKAQAYREIVAAQARRADITGARVTAAGINPNTEWKAEAYRDIADAQTAAGDLIGARKTLTERGVTGDRVSDPSFQAFSNRNIASQHALRGDFAAALASAEGLTDPAQRSVAYRDIAVAEAGVKDFGGALTHAGMITDPAIQVSALARIVKAQILAGDKAGALVTLDRAKAGAAAIQDAFFAKLVRREIAAAQAYSGDWAALSQWIESLQDHDERVTACLGAAQNILDLRSPTIPK